MRIIGLTGGIASGKSTVSRALRQLGATIIDADEVARSVVEVGKPAWQDIVELFGRNVLNQDLTLDREKLGEIVFGDPGLLKELNQITHPRIMEHYKDELQKIKTANQDAIVFIEVPLLYETHMDRICDEVWVVWVSRETQVRRLMERDNLSEEDTLRRIEAQMSMDEKARRANRVIDNSNSIEETIAIATRFYNELLKNNEVSI